MHRMAGVHRHQTQRTVATATAKGGRKGGVRRGEETQKWREGGGGGGGQVSEWEKGREGGRACRTPSGEIHSTCARKRRSYFSLQPSALRL